MSAPDRKRRAGPVGRTRISPVLMRRPIGDPNLLRNASLLATNRRTAPGVSTLDLQVGTGSLTTNQQLALIQAWAAEIAAALRKGGLMETTP